MAEITYLVDSDTSGFFTEAKKYFDARADADSTVVTPRDGTPWTLGGVLDDLRIRGREGEVYPVINLVAHGSAFGAMQLPISDTRRRDEGGIVTLDLLMNAVNKSGRDGFPDVLGAPAVTATTKVCLYGCDVGRDQMFLSLLGHFFGPEVTVYAPLRMAVFRDVNGTPEYRLARSWSTPYPKDVRTSSSWPAARTDVGGRLKARFAGASAEIDAAIASATATLGPTYFWASALDLAFDPATQAVDVSSAVVPVGTLDDSTVPLTLVSSDFTAAGNGVWRAWVATLGQVLEDPVSLENPAHYRKTVLTNGSRAARAALEPQREPVPVPDPVPDPNAPDPEPDPLEDPMKFYGKYRGVVVQDLGDGELKVSVPEVSPDNLVAVPCLPPVPPSLLMWPATNDDVWVEFEAGDPTRPIWTGTLARPALPPMEILLEALNGITLKASEVKVEATGVVEVSGNACSVHSGQATFDGMVKCSTLLATSVNAATYTPGAGNIW